MDYYLNNNSDDDVTCVNHIMLHNSPILKHACLLTFSWNGPTWILDLPLLVSSLPMISSRSLLQMTICSSIDKCFTTSVAMYSTDISSDLTGMYAVWKLTN